MMSGDSTPAGSVRRWKPRESEMKPPDEQHERRAHEMGRRRRQDDDRAEAFAAAQSTAEQDRRALCLQRWPGILAAIQTLVAAYNDGAGRQLLTISEHRENDDPAVTIASSGSARG